MSSTSSPVWELRAPVGLAAGDLGGKFPLGLLRDSTAANNSLARLTRAFLSPPASSPADSTLSITLMPSMRQICWKT